jgi:hypothetical protein
MAQGGFLSFLGAVAIFPVIGRVFPVSCHKGKGYGPNTADHMFTLTMSMNIIF